MGEVPDVHVEVVMVMAGIMQVLLARTTHNGQ